MPDAQQSRQQLVQQWMRLQTARPDLTRGVSFSADNTLNGSLGQATDLGRGRYRIEMDPTMVGKGSNAAQTMTHELGHANERRFITNSHAAGQYNLLRGPGPGRGRGVLLQDRQGIYRTAAVGDLPATERYANDFAAALGNVRSPNSGLYSTAQIHANTLALLQRRGILPK